MWDQTGFGYVGFDSALMVLVVTLAASSMGLPLRPTL